MLSSATKGAVPSGGELPSGAPKRFIPMPKNVYMPNGSGKRCTYDTAAFPARWPTGAAMLYKQEVIITYSIVCVTTPGGHALRAPRVGATCSTTGRRARSITVRSTCSSRSERRHDRRVEGLRLAAGPQRFGDDVRVAVHDGEVGGCASGLVWAVNGEGDAGRARQARRSYKPVQLRTDGLSKWQPLSISVGRYGNVLRIVAMASITGAFRIYTAPHRECAVEADEGREPSRLPESHGLLLRPRGSPRAEHRVAHLRLVQEPRFRAGRPCRGQRDSELATTTRAHADGRRRFLGSRLGA